MSETLTQFGTSFQSKIIASLLGDIKFLQTINDILEPNMFDSDSNKWLIKQIRNYYYEYKKQPTLEVLKVKLENIDNDVLKTGVVDKLRDVWKNIESTDLEFVQSETLDFCKNQTLKNAILESVNLLENKDYDGIKTIIDDAMKAGSTRDLGQDYISSLELRLEESSRTTTETPWDIVNDIIEIIIEGLQSEKKVKIHNFGTFKLNNKRSRNGRNPKTKEEYNIASRNVITFKASKILLKNINNTISD